MVFHWKFCQTPKYILDLKCIELVILTDVENAHKKTQNHFMIKKNQEETEGKLCNLLKGHL